MTFFQCLLCNQYADISRRGGDARKAQLNTLLLATALITLLIIITFVFYGKVNPDFLNKYPGGLGIRGKDIGRLLAAIIGVVIFFLLKLTIGRKSWYDKTIEAFNNKSDEEQKRISRKGIRYFFIASLPVIFFIVDAIFSLFLESATFHISKFSKQSIVISINFNKWLSPVWIMIKASTIQLLRIPFSFFLSPLYFFALAQVPYINWKKAILIFFILHFLIYPASNGYNSYMDRDTESIGGLENPPPPSRQLFLTTIVLDIAGLALSFFVSFYFGIGMIMYVAASKAYSYRGIRLKRYPLIGYLTVIIFQGAVTFWLVYHGSSMQQPLIVPWQGLLICLLLIGGFYPLTQIYQHRQDLEDKVISISYRLGYIGTFIFCAVLYLLAFLLIALWYIQKEQLRNLIMIFILFIPVIVYFTWWFLQVRKNHEAANFKNTMKMNWLASACTNAAFILLLTGRFLG